MPGRTDATDIGAQLREQLAKLDARLCRIQAQHAPDGLRLDGIGERDDPAEIAASALTIVESAMGHVQQALTWLDGVRRASAPAAAPPGTPR